MSKRKQSVLLGGLISSAGIFISKFLGLVYLVPFGAILETPLNRAYYSASYMIYSYILNIATAGLPFAIATLIARYSTRKDYQTCLLVKKISFYTMASFGFICMILMVVASPYISQQIVPTGSAATVSEINTMRNVIILLSLAVFIIPILSSLRGFYQGLKEMQIYSMSQVLEQLIRIIFLLTFGAIAVKVMNKDAVWAVYFGVIAASVSGFLTILYLKQKDLKVVKEIKVLATHQESTSSSQEIFKELLFLAIPFLLISVFGYCDSIINLWDFNPGMEAYGINPKLLDVYQDAVFYKALKLISIPMILAPGFSAAIYPYITSAMESNNRPLVQKYIRDCVDTVIYIALPICFALFVFARPIIYVMFGSHHIDINVEVLKWFSLEALCATVCPIFSSLVMAIGQRKRIVLNTFIFALIKLLINRFLITRFGVAGMVLSSFIAYMIFSAMNLIIIQKTYHVKWKYTFRKMFFMAIALLGFYLGAQLFDILGLMAYQGNRLSVLLLLALMGIVCCGIYVVISSFFQLPQTIFNLDLNKIINRFKRS